MSSRKGQTKDFMILAYPEDDIYPDLLRRLSQLDYCAIVHPADDEKKEHFHAVVMYPFQRSVNAVAKSLGIPERFVEPSRNRRAALRYLIHKDNLEKPQMSEFDVFGTRLDCFQSAIQSVMDETDKLALLLEYIEDYPCTVHLRMTEVLKFSLANGCYDALRRAGSILRQVIDERNIFCRQEIQAAIDRSSALDGFERYVMEE